MDFPRTFYFAYGFGVENRIVVAVVACIRVSGFRIIGERESVEAILSISCLPDFERRWKVVERMGVLGAPVYGKPNPFTITIVGIILTLLYPLYISAGQLCFSVRKRHCRHPPL